MRHVASLALFLLFTVGCGARRDYVPESTETVGHPSGDAGAPIETYIHVARGQLVAVGLADARGVSKEEAIGATNALARSLDSCVASLDREGALVSGAARVIALVGEKGEVIQIAPRASDEAGIARVVVLCIAAPMKALSFSPAPPSSVRRGIAIEATWHGSHDPK